MSALKPCPFCNGFAETGTDDYGDTFVYCTDCMALARSGSGIPAEAIAAWNTRAVIKDPFTTDKDSLTVGWRDMDSAPRDIPLRERESEFEV